MSNKIRPYIIDSTLRDGEQSAGVVFSLIDKLTIAKMLDDIGIDEIEAGIPIMGPTTQTEIRLIAQAGLNAQITSWCRATKEDIDAAIKTGCQGVNISFPVSELQLRAIGKNYQWIWDTLPQLLEYACDRFDYVAIGAQDATRADLDLLLDFVLCAREYGARRVRIADTVGIYDPIKVNALVDEIISKIPGIELEFHGHNDLGMATANAFTALKSGFHAISTTVNGLGERAGNTALEEIIMAMYLDNEFNMGYDTSLLAGLCDNVARSSNIAIPDNKPIVGKKAWQHESGIHTRSLIYDRDTYQPFMASVIGKKEEEFVFGKHSGKAALKFFFQSRGYQLTDENAEYLLGAIKLFSTINKSGLSGEEVLKLFCQTDKDKNQEDYCLYHN